VHVQFERRTEASAKARLLRPDWAETGFGEISSKPGFTLPVLMDIRQFAMLPVLRKWRRAVL